MPGQTTPISRAEGLGVDMREPSPPCKRMAEEIPIHHSWCTASAEMQTCDRVLNFLLSVSWHKVRLFSSLKRKGGKPGKLFPFKITSIFLSSVRTLWQITARYKLQFQFQILQNYHYKCHIFLMQCVEVCADLQEKLLSMVCPFNTTFPAHFQLKALAIPDSSLFSQEGALALA